MNEEQKEFLKRLTCGILDRYNNIDEELDAHNIPKEFADKIYEAFNLIYSVNQSCINK